MDRIGKLCTYLERCKLFADIGCDHGYCTKYMLANNLCERAIISDISPQSLKKAETLLKDHIVSGRCTPICCNGLEKIDQSADLVLIAGMGGEEIISIFKNSFIPKKFVLQPMRNLRQVREFLLERGAEITRDDLFFSNGKYYFVLCGKRKGAAVDYTPAQLEYGKGDLSGELGEYLKAELKKKEEYLTRNLSSASKAQIIKETEYIKGIINGEIK